MSVVYEPIYDLTGKDASFLVMNRRYIVFTANQVIGFGEPVYYKSISIADLTGKQLVENVDWRMQTSYIDYDAMSKAKSEEPRFSSTLVTAIQMITSLPKGQFEINVSYQRFERHIDDTYALDDPRGPKCNPTLLRKMMMDIEDLMNTKLLVEDITSTTDLTAEILPVDIRGDLSSNRIVEEVHQVNVPQNKQLIVPNYGAFYAHDVEVKYYITEAVLTQKDDDPTVYEPREVVHNTITLVENEDYYILGMDPDRTERTYSTSGVYNFIFLVRPIVGSIKVSYRAFGGTVSRVDFKEMKSLLLNLHKTIVNEKVITKENLAHTVEMLEINRRLNALERHMLHFPMERFCVKLDATKINWFNFAFLNNMVWKTDDPLYSQVGEFMIESTEAGFKYLVTVNVNTKAPQKSLDALTIAILSEERKDIDQEIRLRAVWVEPKSTDEDAGLPKYGIVLQLGMRLSATNAAIDKYEILVSNRSGMLSKWALELTSHDLKAPSNDSVILPDLDTAGMQVVWQQARSNLANPAAEAIKHCHSQKFLTTRYQCYTSPISTGTDTQGRKIPGGIVLSNYQWSRDIGSSEQVVAGEPVFRKLLWTDWSPTEIEAIEFQVLDLLECTILSSRSEVTGSIGFTMFFPRDLCVINYRFTGTGNLYSLDINADLGTKSYLMKRFNLLRVLLYPRHGVCQYLEQVPEEFKTTLMATEGYATADRFPFALNRANTTSIFYNI